MHADRSLLEAAPSGWMNSHLPLIFINILSKWFSYHKWNAINEFKLPIRKVCEIGHKFILDFCIIG